MDDTYIWGESPQYVQDVLAELERQLLKLGLRINPKKTQVISNLEDDPFRFRIGDAIVAPDGPQTIMTILGAPINMTGEVAPIIAEMQGRARRAFQQHKKLLCSRAPVKERLLMHQCLVRGAGLWGCPAWPVNASLLQAANSVQLLQVRAMTTGKRSPTEAWNDWHIRTMRKARALLHQHKLQRWSSHALHLMWGLWGHIGRAPFAPTFHLMRWRDLSWWRDQQSLPPGPHPRGVRHIGHPNPDRDPERQIGSIAGALTGLHGSGWKSCSWTNSTRVGQAGTSLHCMAHPTLPPIGTRAPVVPRTRGEPREHQTPPPARARPRCLLDATAWWTAHGLIRD